MEPVKDPNFQNNQNQYPPMPYQQEQVYNNNNGFNPPPPMGMPPPPPMGMPPPQQQYPMGQPMMQAPLMQPPQGQPIYPQQTSFSTGQPVGQPYQPPNYQQGVPMQQTYDQGQTVTAQVIRVQQIGIPVIFTNLDHCDHPAPFKCNFCQKESVSSMQTEAGTGTYTMCCLLCCCFGIFGLIPLCMEDCQNKKHFCPHCGAQVGLKEYKPCG